MFEMWHIYLLYRGGRQSLLDFHSEASARKAWKDWADFGNVERRTLFDANGMMVEEVNEQVAAA